MKRSFSKLGILLLLVLFTGCGERVYLRNGKLIAALERIKNHVGEIVDELKEEEDLDLAKLKSLYEDLKITIEIVQEEAQRGLTWYELIGIIFGVALGSYPVARGVRRKVFNRVLSREGKHGGNPSSGYQGDPLG